MKNSATSACSSQVIGKRSGAAVLVLERALLRGVVHQVAAVEVGLRVVVEGDDVVLVLVLREQVHGRLAAGEAVGRVVPARLVLLDVFAEREQEPSLGEVAELLDRRRDEVEAAVPRRGVPEVVRVLGCGVGLDELDRDPRLLLEELEERRRPFREGVLELRPREVEHLDDELVRRLSVLAEAPQGRDGAALLGVELVLVALGAREADRAAVHALGKPVLERGLLTRSALRRSSRP